MALRLSSVVSPERQAAVDVYNRGSFGCKSPLLTQSHSINCFRAKLQVSLWNFFKNSKGGRAGSRSDKGGRRLLIAGAGSTRQRLSHLGGKRGGKGRGRGVWSQPRVGVRSATQNQQRWDFHMQIPRRAPRSQTIFKEPNKHWMESKARERRSKRGRIGKRRTAGRGEGGAKSRRRRRKLVGGGGRRRRSRTPPRRGPPPRGPATHQREEVGVTILQARPVRHPVRCRSHDPPRARPPERGMSERGVRGEAGPGGGASPGSAGRPGRRRRRPGRARGPANGREAPRRRRAGGGGPGPAGGSAAAAGLLPARAAAAAPAAPEAAGGAVRAARRPPRLSGQPLPPGLALRAGRRLRLPCSSAAAAAALFISSHRLPLGPRRRVKGGEPRSRRRRLGAAAAAERELAKGGVRTKPAGDPGSRATSPPSSSSPTPPSSPVSLASPPSPGSLTLTAMAAADRGSARHWLAPRHVTGAGRAGGRWAGGGGVGAAAARRRRRLAGGAAELLAARFSGSKRLGGSRGGRERSADGSAPRRAAADRPEAAVGCPVRAPRPAPWGYRSFWGTTVSPGNAGVDLSEKLGSPRVCPQPTQPGWRGGGSLWARQPVQVLWGVSRGGRTTLSTFCRWERWSTKRLSPLLGSHSWEEEEAEFEPVHPCTGKPSSWASFNKPCPAIVKGSAYCVRGAIQWIQICFWTLIPRHSVPSSLHPINLSWALSVHQNAFSLPGTVLGLCWEQTPLLGSSYSVIHISWEPTVWESRGEPVWSGSPGTHGFCSLQRWGGWNNFFTNKPPTEGWSVTKGEKSYPC